MYQDAYNLLTIIGKTHALLKEHAQNVGLRADVTHVTRWFDILNIEDAVRYEEYVDAEFVNGQAISWRLELTFTPDEIWIESDVRRYHEQGYDVIATIENGEIPRELVKMCDLAEIVRELTAYDVT